MKTQQERSAYKLISCKIRKLFCIVKGVGWFILFCPGIISAQWMFDFENGMPNQWVQSPPGRWEVSSERSINGQFSLHHTFDNPGPGTDLAYVDLNHPLPHSQLRFSFRIRHAYKPSSGNNWQVYLLSQQATQFENAFVFGVNFKGSDDLIKLWQIVDGESTVIISTDIDYEHLVGISQAPQFEITRDSIGVWKASMEMETEDGKPAVIGEGQELEHSDGKFLGLRYEYSSAQDQKLWMDDVNAAGVFYVDRDPPKLLQIELTGMNSLSLRYNENVVAEHDTYFFWNGLLQDSLHINGNQMQVFFTQTFPNREWQYLDVSGIYDPDGNRMKDTVVGFMQNLVEFGEIKINEIMSDPAPEVYLPPCEYIELFNLTPSQVDLSGWTLMVNARSYAINDCVLPYNAYVLFTSEQPNCTFDGVPTVKIFSSSSGLSNAGATLALFDQYRRLIDMLRYKDMSFYTDEKDEGGWSLECINPGQACGGNQNWSVSSDHSGGTPGRENSVLSESLDLSPPDLKYVGLEDKHTLFLYFSEPVYFDVDAQAQFRMEHFGYATLVDHAMPLVSDVIALKMPGPLQIKTLYSIEIGEVSDCEGNTMEEIVVHFALPDQFKTGEILINEVMYDAFVGQEEYLEFLNTTTAYLDLKDLKYRVDNAGNSMGAPVQVSENSHLLPPGGYVVLSKDEIGLRETWGLDPVVDVVEILPWKTLPNGSGTISLFNRSDILMEKFSYHDSMHHSLLMNPSGVSLERVSINPGHSSWTSAAASVNYGTPGTLNSQWQEEDSGDLWMSITPRVFSPDMDGYEDLCEIVLKTPTGAVINIYITDLYGTEIIKLVENGISANDDRYFWDGHDDNKHLVLPGLYVIHIRISDLQGEKVIRKSCAVTYH